MKQKNLVNLFFALLLLLNFGSAFANKDLTQDSAAENTNSEQGDAINLVRSTADAVLKKISENRDELKADPKLANALVSELILPHFDFTRMTRTAMGRYWKRANESQQSAIVDEFRTLLIRTYSVAVLNYSGQAIEYLPGKESVGKKSTGKESNGTSSLVTVETIVTEADGGPRIPINYRLTETEGAWKVYDVVIDGVSLVANYRTSFSGQIRRGGIDGLISQLKQINDKG